MTTDHAIQVAGAYAAAFGEDQAEALIAPNWFGDPRFINAMVTAINTGVPLTIEAATALCGPPAHDAVV